MIELDKIGASMLEGGKTPRKKEVRKHLRGSIEKLIDAILQEEIVDALDDEYAESFVYLEFEEQREKYGAMLAAAALGIARAAAEWDVSLEQAIKERTGNK